MLSSIVRDNSALCSDVQNLSKFTYDKIQPLQQAFGS